MLVICLVALVAGNVALWFWSRGLNFRRDLDNIQRAQNPDVLFVGNSLLDSRIDSAALNQGTANQGAASGGQTFTPLNTALGATDANDQAFLAQYALQQHPQLHTLVVGFYDYQLTEEDRVTPVDLVGNHDIAFDSRIPVREVAAVDHFDRFQIGELLLLRALPMAAYRLSIWKYAERLRRSMGGLGIPPATTEIMGRPQSYYVTEPQRFRKDPSHFGSSYEYIFRRATATRMHVVLVLMPMSPLHRKVYYTRQTWQEYVTKLQSLAQQRGFTFVDASTWMPDATQFEDAIHMNGPAATAFSFRLGAELAMVAGKSAP